jgi:hypothetical protein
VRSLSPAVGFRYQHWRVVWFRDRLECRGRRELRRWLPSLRHDRLRGGLENRSKHRRTRGLWCRLKGICLRGRRLKHRWCRLRWDKILRWLRSLEHGWRWRDLSLKCRDFRLRPWCLWSLDDHRRSGLKHGCLGSVGSLENRLNDFLRDHIRRRGWCGFRFEPTHFRTRPTRTGCGLGGEKGNRKCRVRCPFHLDRGWWW